MADLSVYQRQKTLSDYMRANEDRAFQHSIMQDKAQNQGSTISAARMLMASDPTLDFPTAFSIAKSGLGQGNTYQQGQVQNIQGAPEAFGNLENAKQTGKNTSDLAYALPIAENTAVGKSKGETKGAYNKKDMQAKDTSYVISQILAKDDQGRDVLDKATGSYPGAALAAGKAFFGKSDESTQANADLAIYGGQLLNNVPRMEGPQSDADLISYKEQAGKIADPKVPAGDKRSALKVMDGLRAKYAYLNEGDTSADPNVFNNVNPNNPPNPPQVKKVDISKIPMGAIKELKADPTSRDEFDATFGVGASDRILGKKR